MFLDLHAIQSVPPANLNRDESGSPKTAFIGGARRARVSSQSWKKAIRDYYKERYAEASGIRTKNVGALIIAELAELAPERSAEERETLAQEALKSVKLSSKKDPLASSALFLTSPAQIRAFAQGVLEGADSKRLNALLKSGNSLDLALFGRMVADDTSLNVEAACQFAHAFSTHAVEPEFDFFTAVDENSAEDHAGAGMVGEIEYNSATLYRFATVDLNALAANLSVDADELAAEVNNFVEAFAHAIPSGKQNTFAARTHPDFLLLSLRKDYPVSFANAFEAPVSSKLGYSLESQRALIRYAQAFADAYGTESTDLLVRFGAELGGEYDFGRQLSMTQALAELRDHVAGLN